MEEVVENSLRLSDHGEQVARQFYLQSTPAEASRLLSDAQRIKKDGPAKFIDLDLNASSQGVEAQMRLSHRHIGWSTLARLARKGTIHWAPVSPMQAPKWTPNLPTFTAVIVAVIIAVTIAVIVAKLN